MKLLKKEGLLRFSYDRWSLNYKDDFGGRCDIDFQSAKDVVSYCNREKIKVLNRSILTEELSQELLH